MATVVNCDDFEKMLKIFKRKVLNEGILKEYKEKSRFEKKSDKRRRYKKEIESKIRKINNKKLYDVD